MRTARRFFQLTGSLLCVCFGLMPLNPATAQDVKNSSDHPMVSRFEGSVIKGYRSAKFDEYRLVKASVNGYRGGEQAVAPEQVLDDSNSLALEGRVTAITYDAPEDSSTLQIFRSYQRALEQSGFKTIFTCSNAECVGNRPPSSCTNCGNWETRFADAIVRRANYTLYGNIHENQRYLAARLPRAQGDVYVSLFVVGLKKPLTQLDIVEVAPLEEGLVSVNASAMAQEIRKSGSVSLYGIYFETDSASLTSPSEPTLKQIAQLLQDEQALGLLVVGHTDNTGSFQRNVTLSNERAKAVVDALVSRYRIPQNRLTPFGVGQTAPVATNATEKGRAQNRRVTLVAR
jgi:OmpA-OmpF porin, OOP family